MRLISRLYIVPLLETKGFKVHLIAQQDIALFATEAPKADVLWILSGQHKHDDEEEHTTAMVELCVAHHRAGKGIAIFAQHHPLDAHANLLLKALGTKVSFSTCEISVQSRFRPACTRTFVAAK